MWSAVFEATTKTIFKSDYLDVYFLCENIYSSLH